MADTWRAKGILEPLWKRLPRTDGKSGPGRRDDMAELTGINAPDLSAINQGKRPLNPERAAKIRALFPGEQIYLGEPDEQLSLQAQLIKLELMLGQLLSPTQVAAVEVQLVNRLFPKAAGE